MAFEIQDLPDVIRVIVLLNLSKGKAVTKTELKQGLDKVCASLACIDVTELEKTLKEMSAEGLIIDNGDAVRLTEQV